MTAKVINAVRNSVKQKNPLIHCITNPISITACANALLAIGTRPIMAEHPGEVEEITCTADALSLNLGNITDVRMKSMQISAKTAKENNIPFVVDAVGIACSTIRRDYVCSLIENYTPSVIKGNYSEINALCNSSYRSAGVDADCSLDEFYICKAASELAKKYNTTVLASGKTDVITDGLRAVFVKNGTVWLTSVTGTGCMLGALCAGYLSANSTVSAAVTACAVLGICGQLVETDKGLGSFALNLMDKLSCLTDADVIKYLKSEEIEIESI